MALSVDLSGKGLPTGISSLLGDTSGTAAAAGSTLAGATALTASINYITSVATSQGVSLPIIGNIGGSSPVYKTPIWVKNAGTASLTVYPGVATDAIDQAGAGTGIAVGTKATAVFIPRSGTQWVALVGAATT